MAERQEPTGGVRGQLRSLAERGSLEGGWQHPRNQSVYVHRQASLPEDGVNLLKVGFTAEKYNGNTNPGAPVRLLTRYSLRTSVVCDELPPEFVPPHVQFALKEKRLLDWTKKGSKTLIIPTSDTNGDGMTVSELVYEDLMDIDYELFRFEREVGYIFDGRGQLVQEQLSEQYSVLNYVEPLTEVETVSHVLGTIDFRDNDGFTKRWVEKGREEWEFTDGELLKHPDLLSMEYFSEEQTLHNDLVFAELVQSAEADKGLNAISRKQHQTNALAMLAFLRYDAPSADITKLLYE